MRKLVSTAMIGLLLFTPSCTLLGEKGVQDLNAMSEPDYLALTSSIKIAATFGGKELKKNLDNTNTARQVIAQLREEVQQDDIRVLGRLMDVAIGQLVMRIDDPDLAMLLSEVAVIVEAAVGPLELNFENPLTERQRGLVLALLEGLDRGLQ